MFYFRMLLLYKNSKNKRILLIYSCSIDKQKKRFIRTVDICFFLSLKMIFFNSSLKLDTSKSDSVIEINEKKSFAERKQYLSIGKNK